MMQEYSSFMETETFSMLCYLTPSISASSFHMSWIGVLMGLMGEAALYFN